jgi:hypothetical protein
VLSNAKIYLDIAVDAFEMSKQIEEASRRSKPDGQPGFVVIWDPEHKSFKQNLIAIAFAGIYLEALLYIVGVDKLGKEGYKKIDRDIYEKKLESLGIADLKTLKTCKQFREARNDLVHEKAIDPQAVGEATFRAAQREAENAVAFVQSITDLLKASEARRGDATSQR